MLCNKVGYRQVVSKVTSDSWGTFCANIVLLASIVMKICLSSKLKHRGLFQEHLCAMTCVYL